MRIQFAYGRPDLLGNLSRAGDTLAGVNNWLFSQVDSWARRGGWERVGLVNSLPVVGDWAKTMDRMRSVKDTGYSPREAAYPFMAAPDLFGWMNMPFSRGGRRKSRGKRRHAKKRY